MWLLPGDTGCRTQTHQHTSGAHINRLTRVGNPGASSFRCSIRPCAVQCCNVIIPIPVMMTTCTDTVASTAGWVCPGTSSSAAHRSHPAGYMGSRSSPSFSFPHSSSSPPPISLATTFLPRLTGRPEPSMASGPSSTKPPPFCDPFIIPPLPIMPFSAAAACARCICVAMAVASAICCFSALRSLVRYSCASSRRPSSVHRCTR
mmetsp:Transcript_18443/g.39634  ORF Transcript_18443/g.39634 Transcript_18443/m.39634 type:complete len:204 (+) Transcript_18443:378-989(+)